MANPPKALEAHWYQILKAEGFEDIEDTKNPDRPLKRWESFDFTRERNHARRLKNQDYQSRIDRFFQNKSFQEIAALLIRHGNAQITVVEVKRIVDMHREGFTEREIAVEVRRSKTCIHHVILRIREWMRLL